MADETTDHNTIRKLAESKGGKPTSVERTHRDGDIGIIRIMFPDNPQSEHGALTEDFLGKIFLRSLRRRNWS